MIALLLDLKSDLEVLSFALLFVFAMLRGGAPERLLSGLMVAMFLVHRLYHLAAHGSVMFGAVNMGHFAIDLVMLADFGVIALYANRVYPLWMAAAQLIAVIAHVYLLVPAIAVRYAYDVMTITPSYMQVVFLALGLGSYVRRHGRSGSVRDWRESGAGESTAPDGPWRLGERKT
ncbi:hypothetical protein MTR62_04900 [Novosphingobium sp. 1949]|uniref:Uncharacterized protein n=1 Tax=Novosphingobium organovorum TaxID=2930092 RepID=A0ABT0BB21_9SPHN|nr:hypothetical protein [Novosphingobium organovorum]MCJ2182043.1 hypothetical protein [Novosphingobium organovorum]